MSIETSGGQLDIALRGGTEVALRCAELVRDNAHTRMNDTAIYVGTLAANGNYVPTAELQELASVQNKRIEQANDELSRARDMAVELTGTAEA